jgi:hypothetical protein
VSSSQSLADVVATGTELESLTALRDRLAVEIDKFETKPAEVASLSRQLVDVLGRIAAIKPPTKSKVDEIAERREARRTATSG